MSIDWSTFTRSDTIFFTRFNTVGFMSFPRRLSSTTMYISWRNITPRNQCSLWISLQGKKTASCLNRSPLPFRSFRCFFFTAFSNSSHPKTSMQRPFSAFVVLTSCKFESTIKFVIHFASSIVAFPSNSCKSLALNKDHPQNQCFC